MTSQKSRRADMFLDLADDPRENIYRLGDERTTLTEYLRCQRHTLIIKCSELTPHQMAQRSIPATTMTLLGMVRHLTDVERGWIRRIMANQAAPPLYYSKDDPDGDWDNIEPTIDAVHNAWETWQAETSHTDLYIHNHDLAHISARKDTDPISLREVIVHLIEEYARHNGHADLLREHIDGRLGQ